MKQEEIDKAFQGRWRMKGSSTIELIRKALDGSLTQQELSVKIAALCRDFFEAGILLSKGSVVSGISAEQSPVIPMSAIVESAREASFCLWWDMYGKKIDRAKCFKKWQKMTDAERDACIAATPAYVASTPDLQYRRHPATYLNNKSWENQIIPHSNGNNKPTAEQQRISKLADILTD